MNNAQEKLVTKVAGITVLLILIAVSAAVLSKWLPHEWLAKYGETVKWSAFLVFIIAGALASKSDPITTRSERQAVVSVFYDEHPWAKVYLACCVIAIAIGLYFVATYHIDMGAVMEKLGMFGFLGAIFLLILPIVIVKLKEAYDAAGKEE